MSFLAHVERCGALAVVEVDPPAGAPEPAEAYRTVRDELSAYGAGLAELPEIVCSQRLTSFRPRAPRSGLMSLLRRSAQRSDRVLSASSATREGLDELLKMFRAVPVEARPEPAAGEEADEFEAEHMVYRPAADQGFEVMRENEAWRVEGKGIELLVARHRPSNLEALSYLEAAARDRRDRRARTSGLRAGDDVRIGEEEFELHPADARLQSPRDDRGGEIGLFDRCRAVGRRARRGVGRVCAQVGVLHAGGEDVVMVTSARLRSG